MKTVYVPGIDDNRGAFAVTGSSIALSVSFNCRQVLESLETISVWLAWEGQVQDAGAA